MITNIFSDSILVCKFKEPQTCNLVQMFILLPLDDSKLFLANAIGTHQLNKVFMSHGFERTPVELIFAWLDQVDCFGASPWFIVLPFTLTTITMPNVVRVILLKLIRIDVLLLDKFLLPKCQRFFHCQTYTFQEQTHLEPTIMFQVMVLFQIREKTFDTRWHRFTLMIIQILKSDFL